MDVSATEVQAKHQANHKIIKEKIEIMIGQYSRFQVLDLKNTVMPTIAPCKLDRNVLDYLIFGPSLVGATVFQNSAFHSNEGGPRRCLTIFACTGNTMAGRGERQTALYLCWRETAGERQQQLLSAQMERDRYLKRAPADTALLNLGQ